MATQTYHGSCQCGAIRLHADLDLDQAIACNCSRCRRVGAVWVFTPGTAFHLDAGEDATTEYRFNKQVLSHRFCRTCGVQPFATGQMGDTPTVAVNVNCLDGVDARALNVQHYDGASV
jgi:hypothetical protein